jgi:small subunit ribosomal protein S20
MMAALRWKNKRGVIKMANIKGAIKRAKQAVGRRARNRAEASGILTVGRRFMHAVSAGDKGKAIEAFNVYCSALDKAAKKGIIKPNNAARKKTRASSKIAKMG